MGGQMALGAGGAAAVRLLTLGAGAWRADIPTGGTLPAAAKAVTVEGDDRRRDLSLLYGFNTLGAVGGAALLTFFMLEMLGTRNTILAAGIVNTACGVAAMLLSRLFLTDADTEMPPSTKIPRSESPVAEERTCRPRSSIPRPGSPASPSS